MGEDHPVPLPSEGLLASFGEEWPATLTKTVTAAGADLPRARTTIEVGSTRG